MTDDYPPRDRDRVSSVAQEILDGTWRLHEPVRFVDGGAAIQVSSSASRPRAAVEGWLAQGRVNAILASAGEEGGYDINGVTVLIKGSCVSVYETLAWALIDFRSYRKAGENDGLLLIPFVPERTWPRIGEYLAGLDYTVEDRRRR